jgi:hypothetical protein
MFLKKGMQPKYKNNYELEVELRFIYPSLFDFDRIKDNLRKYFEKFFSENPVTECNYNGMGMLLMKGLKTDSCLVKVIFEEEKIEFLSDYQTKDFKSQLSKMTGIHTQSIMIEYMTLDDTLDEMRRKNETIQKLDELESELDNAIEDLNYLMDDLKKNKDK